AARVELGADSNAADADAAAASAAAAALPAAARAELIFTVFRTLCLGGALCQFDDTVEPYFDATRAIYKELAIVLQEILFTKEEEGKGVKNDLNSVARSRRGFLASAEHERLRVSESL
ncbi:hypothetical protein HK405_010989, partial [Cladochytrium tenue]